MKLNFLFAPLLVLLVGFVRPAVAAPIALKAGVAIYIGADETAPILLAARDLARDCRAVLGKASPIVNNRAALRGKQFIEIIGPNADAATKADARADISGVEAHGVFAVRDKTGARIALQGADMRGTIYAIYTFSEQFLGVKPLWFWASQPPSPKPSLQIADDTNVRFGPADVRWRAWFPNDRDFYAPWRELSQTNYDALFEAMLRLKMNCLEGDVADAGSFEPPYPLGRETATAQARGLAFVGHHINPLGSSYYQWDDFWRKVMKREPPEMSVNNTADLETFWRWHAELAKRHNLEEIWLISFRGKGDRMFWLSFADSPKGNKERAELIEKMMRRQVEIVKEVTGEAQPIMRTTLYNELSDFYADGLLRPPAEPNLIWTFVAAVRDHYPAPDARNADLPDGQPYGYYFNFQYTNTGAHIVPAEGPWKMERNYRFIQGISPRPLDFAVVNMGNIREFVTEGSANAAMMWDFKGYDTDKWLSQYCQRYYGERHAADVAALYRDYFDSYWQQRPSDLPDFKRQYIFQDMRYGRAMRELIDVLKDPGAKPLDEILKDKRPTANSSYFNIVPAEGQTRLDAFIAGTGASTEKLKALGTRSQALMPQLPAASRTFFSDELLVRSQFMLATNQAAHNLALAIRDGDDKAAKAAHISAAKTALADMSNTLEYAEHGVFRDWYETDLIFKVKEIRDELAPVTP